jgi:hypothetical protein
MLQYVEYYTERDASDLNFEELREKIDRIKELKRQGQDVVQVLDQDAFREGRIDVAQGLEVTALDIVNEYVRINDLKLSEEKKTNYENKKPILDERYKIPIHKV